ncbi:MAG: hypothetical protein FJX74_05565 [Armatimonadetes bacterium]|nr:hypothetical protein [Armatimonadota bacterium]
MAKRESLSTTDPFAGAADREPPAPRVARARVFREVSPEERARIVERLRQRLAGPALRVDSATLRQAEGDSV